MSKKRDNETIDSLRVGGLRIIQAKAGYRFSLDPILLARFVEVRPGERIVDLGTGAGIIPLQLARLTQAAELLGIELQPALAERARRNVELNGLDGKVRIVSGDLRQSRQLLPAGLADLVVSNPPYRKPENGRVAPDDERAAARHELAGGLEDFVAAAAWLLKNGGRFAVIYLTERLPELLGLLGSHGIEPKRLRMVYPRQTERARMVLVEGRKGGRPGLTVESPLVVYRGAGRDYTQEVLRMYGAEGG